MFDSSKLWLLLAPTPFASGARFHRAALQALHAGRWGAAERLFEKAATRYRRELACEALARLRVHQGVARLRSGTTDADAPIEIERSLARLDQIEDLEPPFALVPAHAVMGHWLADAEDEPEFEPARAA